MRYMTAKQKKYFGKGHKARHHRARAVTGTRSHIMRSRVHRSHKLTIPLAPALGFAVPFGFGINQVKEYGWQTGLANTVTTIVPFNPNTGKWDFSNLKYGTFPIVAGLLVHKVVGGMLGVNKMLARHNVPFLRI